MSHVDTASERSDTSVWTHRILKFCTPNTGRALMELAITVIPYTLLWYAMYWALSSDRIWLYVLLLLPTVGFLVRLFLIQHDCGHQAFFPGRSANTWVGRVLGVLTLTAYGHWRHAHAIHHATSGHLGKRGVGDIDTLTVAEYQARTFLTRLRYRLYRNSLILFCIGPAFVFLLQNRLPAGFMRDGWRPWLSTMGTNVAILAGGVLMGHSIGYVALLLIGGPVVVLGAAVGGWLFYVQHQFSDTYWEATGRWNAREASLHGSSYYDLPPPLRWFTANIGVHHVHHLCSRIPFYRLRDVLADQPKLQTIGRLTLWQSFGCRRLALWDETRQRLVSFAEARRRTISARPI